MAETDQQSTICPKCGKALQISEHPFCPHGFATNREYRPFVPYFDDGLGEHITSLAHWNRVMREKKCDLRDPFSKGQMSAYLDKRHEMKKEHARR